ncbi:hypothetical protein V1264_012187 [Littorina saxatilis]|uniref:Phosphatidylinositol N-acetylglucosaminyltransferase subunit Q n=2 Tax=Littorina saxatilis TaxID=31220 RepID=A0AAN9BWG4_9CAEN
MKSACASPLKSSLVLFDTCGQQLLDSALGVAVMLFVVNTSCADNVATAVMHWADDTASYLNDLLHWLMGAPAGLKLNAQLTEYMGHFFIYHVYLWSGYLSVLRPVLGWVIWTAAVFGMLGISTQLCFMQDIVSMLTLHIYCFYVYAARLYSLQAYALSSFWRLFRGKKWNVLRLRVDSALYNIDQLCIGTLLFTVLLFLLPTTLLYYFVFMTLRLVVLSFHGLLTIAIESLNNIPVATFILRVFKSKSVAGDLLFAVVQGQENIEKDKCLKLSLQTTQLPMKTLYQAAVIHLKIEPENPEQNKYSWAELLQKLVSGHLVYPWVNPYDRDNKEKLS